MPLPPILKNSTRSTNAPSSSRPANRRHLDVALHHANIIEQQKRTERQIVNAMLLLLDFPSSCTADPQRPSPSDARQFIECMTPFQPSDYDELIEERNISDRCGYVLCPRPKARAPTTARKQFVRTDRGLEIVDRKKLEMWCCDDCARRALYVKVQLKEEPAWLRQGGAAEPIELLVENADEQRSYTLAFHPKQEPAKPPAAPDDDDVAAAWAAHDGALADLAVERGERPGGPSKANEDLVAPTITERVGTAPVAPSQDDGGSQSHMAIEGHIPRSSGRKKKGDEEDDDDAQDWDKHLP